MSRSLRFASVALSVATTLVLVNAAQPKDQPAPTPLVDKSFSYPSGIPYQVDTDKGLDRGGQFGYNLCNSTTEGPDSRCQTGFVNALDDFCVWAPPEPNSVIGDTEGETVAWCTKPGRGTRMIPEGALKGVQFMRTPDYVQVVGFVDQTKINIKKGDGGGEMDPHGADLRGNPLGGLVYSTAWSGNNDTYDQVHEWHNFMGSDMFCFKACDPKRPNAARLCEHVFDRIGCEYNAPNHAESGIFESCEGDNQLPPGIYVVDGATKTYTQPPESEGPITSIPYAAFVPASSNCVQYKSEDIYAKNGAAITGTASTEEASPIDATESLPALAVRATNHADDASPLSLVSLVSVLLCIALFV